MLRLILLFMIGDYISAPPAYWIVYTIACVLWLIRVILNIIKEAS